MGFLTSFLYSQLFVTPPIPTKNFSNQTIIITGSNTGLGLEAAVHISRLNAELIILAVRNTAKGEEAKQTILSRTQRPTHTVEVWELDLQSFTSIQSFATKAQKLSRLDAVIENAGIMTKHFKLVSGHESTIMTNVIGTFFLAVLLLPKLRETAEKFGAKTHLSVVTSNMHFAAKFPEQKADEGRIFETLSDEKRADMSMERYAF